MTSTLQEKDWQNMLHDYTAVIQAGGKGTRMAKLTENRIPKPMLRLNGKPMLQWQIENLARCGIRDFIIIIGHLGNQVKEYFKDGAGFGVRIEYLEETQPLGSAGALYCLKHRIHGDFLFIFGDVMFDIDVERMVNFHHKNMAEATLLVHPNSHPHDSDLVILDERNCVLGFDPKSNRRDYWYDNCVNAGIYVLSEKVPESILDYGKLDLEKDILSILAKEKRVYGYRTTEYVKDAGTPERFKRVEEEQKNGIWESRNLKHKQRCIFLDRDGTINVYNGLISREEDFRLEQNAPEAIQLINESGYLAIVVSNQPVVARGMCEIQDVQTIHKKMTTLLGREGAYLDDITFCPHHPDKGYPEENPIYKVKCPCRKPAIGMITEMAKKYNIDLSGSYIIGDSPRDIQTGKNAGLGTVLVRTGEEKRGLDISADIEAKDILDAVKKIISL